MIYIMKYSLQTTKDNNILMNTTFIVICFIGFLLLSALTALVYKVCKDTTEADYQEILRQRAMGNASSNNVFIDYADALNEREKWIPQYEQAEKTNQNIQVRTEEERQAMIRFLKEGNKKK